MISYTFIFLISAYMMNPSDASEFCDSQCTCHRSPIDLNLLVQEITLPNLVFTRDLTPASYNVINNGKLVEIRPTVARNLRPAVEFGPLNEKHYLVKVQFHWADEDNAGSQHSFSGRRYAAEVQAVFGNSKYDESVLHTKPDAYFIIAFAVKACDFGVNVVDNLLSLSDLVKTRNTNTVVRNTAVPLAWRETAFQVTPFYIYEGSLTTGQFPGKATYAVRGRPLCAGPQALAKLRAANTDRNVQDIQPRNSRAVFQAVF